MWCVDNDLYKLNHVIDVLTKSKTQLNNLRENLQCLLVISYKLLLQIRVFGQTQSGIRGSSILKNCK
jgi:hypothetical protein